MHIGVLALRSIESNSASTSHDIFRSLQKDHDVRHLGREFVSALSGSESLLRRIRRWTDGDSVLKEDADAYAAAVSEDLARERCDIVLGLFSSRLMASIELPDGVPFVHMSDATPVIRPVPRSRYPLSELITLEQRVLEDAALCLYPSHWAGTSALEDLGSTTARSTSSSGEVRTSTRARPRCHHDRHRDRASSCSSSAGTSSARASIAWSMPSTSWSNEVVMSA